MGTAGCRMAARAERIRTTKVRRRVFSGRRAGVCHGPLGLLKAEDTDGKPLVEGRRLTAVSDLQVRQLGVQITPLHPETELRKQGAVYEKKSAFRDYFATHVVVDGNLVTGQNQNSGAETAHRMMELVDR